MTVRKAKLSELGALMNIYDYARAQMRKNGNFRQWTSYPSQELIEDDIRRGICHVLEENGVLCGVFALIGGIDPTYLVIENGNWLNDEPYYTIHRIASAGVVPGVVRAASDYAFGFTDNVRIDTHEDNKPMQHVLSKLGFTQCGIIYISDGTPRIAYQKSRSRQ